MKDYYDILGVSREASQEDIKKAFRKLARDTHPDANPEDPAAEARFREIAEAYEILSDPQRRGAFDRGEQFGAGDLFSNFGGLDDILQQFFGGGFGGFGGTRQRGPARGGDVGVVVDMSLAEAATGVSRNIEVAAPERCPACGGAGAEPGHDPRRCPTCNGAGQVQVARQTMLGSMMTVTDCATCRGRGEIIDNPCKICSGQGRIDSDRSLTVEIPAGVDDGTRLRLSGRGGVGERGAPPGDLYVQVRIAANPNFSRVGSDLHYKVQLGIAEATLGKEISVPLVDGSTTEIDIPAGTQSASVFRLSRQGMPRLQRRGHGDLLIEVEVVIPADLSPEEEQALRSFASMRGEEPADGKRRKRKRRGR
ncbi:MAG: molecular chaperone DnaJ [Acidimicrobiia bacterium]|nr:molecular chaperone DnaJ [Acidimicrobiia bacterium]MDX2467498.1 molecular chaperone DnaJ [Acidimicrobiia bacterium]